MAAMAAADGHIESNCCSVREGRPVAEQTNRKDIRLKRTESVEHPHMYVESMYTVYVYTLQTVNRYGFCQSTSIK